MSSKNKQGSRKMKFRTLPFNVNVIVEEASDITVENIEFEELEGVVHLNGDVTVVVLEDGSKGIATKGAKDAYDESIGIEIAFRRAYIQFLENEIKAISSERIF